METEKVNNKKIHTPFELFYDEGLSKTGWAGLLLPLYADVKEWNKDKTEDDHKFQFSQIKEKWGCYDELTEVLTDNGWKLFKDVVYEDKIATLNPDTHHLEYYNPTNIFSYDYNGKMYKLTNRGVDLLVTPNHKLYIAYGSYVNPKDNIKRTYPFELTTPDKYFGKKKRFLKGGAIYESFIEYPNIFTIPDYVQEQNVLPGKRINYTRTRVVKGWDVDLTSFVRFLGFYVAEGYTGHEGRNTAIAFNYKNENERNILIKLIKDINIDDYKIDEKSGLLKFQHKALGVWLLEECGHLAWNKKCPNFIKNSSPYLIKEFLTYLYLGDGHQAKTSQRLTTTSERLHDDVCELLVKIGDSFGIKTKTPRIIKKTNFWEGDEKERIIQSKRNSYDINWLKLKDIEFTHKSHKYKKYYEGFVDYIGKIYCVEVPNHIIYVRRNNIGVWCGNSLQLYNFGATEEQWKRIRMCEKASNHICMNCGSPFKVGKTKNGWITTLCMECAEKHSEDWKLQYDSIRITPIIKIALKLQKFGFLYDEIIRKIEYKIYGYKGYMKFFFYHNILKSDKLDNTIFNYKKY